MPVLSTDSRLPRRDFLTCGMLGGTSFGLSQFLRMADAGEVRDGAAEAGIFIELQGGPSHIDTFDMKPDAPAEYRGEFRPIKTNVPGIEICEHLPRLATCADKFAIVRGVSHTFGAHALGVKYINTGNPPVSMLGYPGYSAVMAKERPTLEDIPPAVAIPESGQSAGFLGTQYAPFNTRTSPRSLRPFPVRGIVLDQGLTPDRVHRRQRLLSDLDQALPAVESDRDLLDGLDRFGQQAHAIITSQTTRDAFDLSQVSPRFAQPFGRTQFGLSCLLATRLIAAGVRFVTIRLGGWDTHTANFRRLERDLLPKLDEGLSALLTGLESKGLLRSTAVLVAGEFGRTPKVNDKQGGRDHHPQCMSVLLAGGSVRGGQVVGQSDGRAESPRDNAYSPDDVAATFYHNLGIDASLEYLTPNGRPVKLVGDGTVIRKLHGSVAEP